MTLNEAILEEEKLVKTHEESARIYKRSYGENSRIYTYHAEGVKIHRQYAEWLKDYRRLLEKNEGIVQPIEDENPNPCIKCHDQASCVGCPERFDWEKRNEVSK